MAQPVFIYQIFFEMNVEVPKLNVNIEVDHFDFTKFALHSNPRSCQYALKTGRRVYCELTR